MCQDKLVVRGDYSYLSNVYPDIALSCQTQQLSGFIPKELWSVQFMRINRTRCVRCYTSSFCFISLLKILYIIILVTEYGNKIFSSNSLCCRNTSHCWSYHDDYSRDTCISTAKYDGYKEWQYVISHDGVGQDAFKDRG